MENTIRTLRAISRCSSLVKYFGSNQPNEKNQNGQHTWLINRPARRRNVARLADHVIEWGFILNKNVNKNDGDDDNGGSK